MGVMLGVRAAPTATPNQANKENDQDAETMACLVLGVVKTAPDTLRLLWHPRSCHLRSPTASEAPGGVRTSSAD